MRPFLRSRTHFLRRLGCVSIHGRKVLATVSRLKWMSVKCQLSFYRAVEETVFETLKAGIYGWQVIDCHVAMTAARHSSPSSTAADFRKLTPLVLATALSSAHAVVCEPVDRFLLEVPAAALTATLTLLARCGASPKEQLISDAIARLEGTITSAMVQTVQRQLPGLSAAARACWRVL